ncbi:hypothetical protein [Pseudonocardia acaciae]|uniref:hypothetical protein n=1 Tax=Pseudonocardia acaciae TaxID=551276 RepID=UPI00048E40B9|nr:hypothetical protein [Pseudonocardia acaciae]
MLKKVITRAAAAIGVVATAAVVSTVSTTGVAYAHGENNPDCSSHEKTKQVNKGTQVIGNIIAKHLNGGIAGSIEKPGLCPSVLNNNKVFSR